MEQRTGLTSKLHVRLGINVLLLLNVMYRGVITQTPLGIDLDNANHIKREFVKLNIKIDRLCGLVVRVLGYR
jgi:hypothetical protein